jgi:hypothetical protein
VTDDHLSPTERLAVVRACLDQALASVRRSRSPRTVSVGAAEWAALIEAISPTEPRCSCRVRVPRGQYAGLTLAEVARSPNGDTWLEWATRRLGSGLWPELFDEALDEFLRTHEVTA